MNARKAYPSDLSEQEWAWIEPLLPKRRDPRGAKTIHTRRELLNAIFYVVRQGIVWEALPHDFPPYKTVYDYFRKLNRQGVWTRIADELREQVRVVEGREAQPRVVLIDSQASKTTEKGGHVASTPSSVSKGANGKW